MMRNSWKEFVGMTTSACGTCHGSGKIIDAPCTACHGSGTVQGHRKLEVKIPAGVDTGSRLRVPGEGEAGKKGRPPGDLYVEMKIPPGTQNGNVFRLRGKGFSSLHISGKGDQLVKIKVEVPTKLNDRQKELLREFAEASGEKSRSKGIFEKVREK